MPAGRYALFGDIVHANGIGETVTAQIDLPEIHGVTPDRRRCGQCLARRESELQSGCVGIAGRISHDLGGRRALQSMRAGRTCSASAWRMPAGRAPGDMQLYMGMAGHAAFVSTDANVFAHVHPSGSVPMAALGLAQGSAQTGQSARRAHDDGREGCPPRCPFRTGFPNPARTASSCR